MANWVFLSENRLQAWMDRDICSFSVILLHTIIILFFFWSFCTLLFNALFRITPISVNDILASFPISYWFLPSFKSLKTEIFFNNISNYTKQNLKTLVTTCYLFCCLVIIFFQLLPMYSIWILIISNNSCYVWVRSDGNQNRNCTSSWSWISW